MQATQRLKDRNKYSGLAELNRMISSKRVHPFHLSYLTSESSRAQVLLLLGRDALNSIVLLKS
jgi:hypothetical protein